MSKNFRPPVCDAGKNMKSSIEVFDISRMYLNECVAYSAKVRFLFSV